MERNTDKPGVERKAGDGSTPSRAFSRGHRLLKAGDFSHVFSGAIRSSDRYFTVLGRAPRVTVRKPRLGLAISKRHLRRAVDRNRIKRLVRECFRTEVIPGSTPLDYVVMARPPVLREDNQRLSASLCRHFRRIQEQATARCDTDRTVP